ncbi:MAG: hypothetical protein U9P14_03015, partial [Gemmatimonadota bacterium]|nr:hypothetical protein [Gemmatimonadota bacterium]
MTRRNQCALCGKRRGKRSCPVAGDLICPQCCGRNRSLDFGCPTACSYLQVTASQSTVFNRISMEAAEYLARGRYEQAARMLAGAFRSN